MLLKQEAILLILTTLNSNGALSDNDRAPLLHNSPVTQKGGGREASPFFKSSVRLGAVHRSAAPWPPTGRTRSTLGAMGLSFRVRNGTGRAPHALAADRWAAPTVSSVSGVSLTCPGGRMAHRRGDSGASSCPDRAFERMSRGPRGAVPEELGRLVRLG